MLGAGKGSETRGSVVRPKVHWAWAGRGGCAVWVCGAAAGEVGEDVSLQWAPPLLALPSRPPAHLPTCHAVTRARKDLQLLTLTCPAVWRLAHSAQHCLTLRWFREKSSFH